MKLHEAISAIVLAFALVAPAAHAQAPAGAAGEAVAPANDAERAATALLAASVPGVADELARQFLMIADEDLVSGQPESVQAKIREHFEYVIGLIRAAIEQRWVAPEPRPLPPRVQQALDRTIADSGRRGEVGAARPPTRDAVARALAQRFTPEQLAAIADFLSSPEGRSISYRFSVGGVRDQNPSRVDLPPAERAALDAFRRTPAGEAYMESAGWMTEMVEEELRLNVMTHAHELMREALGGMCAIMPKKCE